MTKYGSHKPRKVMCDGMTGYEDEGTKRGKCSRVLDRPKERIIELTDYKREARRTTCLGLYLCLGSTLNEIRESTEAVARMSCPILG